MAHYSLVHHADNHGDQAAPLHPHLTRPVPMVLPDFSSRPNIRSNPRLSQINLQLDTLSAKMDRKLFKSPPIARLKSAPKARTDKKIRVSNYTKARGSIAKYTRKLSIKGLFNPGRPPPSRMSPVGNRNYINSAPSNSRSSSKKKSHKLADLRPKSGRNKVGEWCRIKCLCLFRRI